MSSLMMKAAMVLFASLLSGGKPSAAKKRADAARSLTGRLTAILVGIGASVVVAGGRCLVKNAVSASAGDVARALRVWPSATRCAARGAASWRPGRYVTGAGGRAGLHLAGSRVRSGRRAAWWLSRQAGGSAAWAGPGVGRAGTSGGRGAGRTHARKRPGHE